jgi:hypothetical protein
MPHSYPGFWIAYADAYAHSLAEVARYNLKYFASLFEAGGVESALSPKAARAALFIMLYRGYPLLQLPFQLISALLEVDENLSLWRNRHRNMVHRIYWYPRGRRRQQKSWGLQALAAAKAKSTKAQMDTWVRLCLCAGYMIKCILIGQNACLANRLRCRPMLLCGPGWMSGWCRHHGFLAHRYRALYRSAPGWALVLMTGCWGHRDGPGWNDCCRRFYLLDWAYDCILEKKS